MKPLDRFVVMSVFWALCLGSPLFGQQTNTPVWDLGVFPVPPGFDPSPRKEWRDASELLRRAGLSTPPGSEALLDANSSRLFVRNTPENMSLAETLVAGCGLGSPTATETLEIRVFECKLDNRAGLPPKEISCADLEKLSLAELKLVDSFSVSTKSGFTSGLDRGSPQRGQRKENFDSKIEIFVAPDALTASAVISAKIDLPDSTSLSVSGAYALRTSQPAVLTTLPHPNGNGSTFVILGNLTRQDPTGREIEIRTSPNNQ